MGKLDGKVAVITGGTRGLGLAMARTFGREGAAVVVASRAAQSVEQAVAELRSEGLTASGIAVDVGDLVQVEALAAHAINSHGQFDIWVNNAALSAPYGPTAYVPTEAFTTALRTNIFGTYYGSVVALRHLLPRRTGRLVNLLGRGDTGPVPNQNAYGSSKTWVRSFTLALAKEHRQSGVGIHAFNPGLTTTEMLSRPSAVQGNESAMQALKTVVRLWGNPPEVPANRVLHLVSGETDGQTGLEVHVLTKGAMVGGLLREGWRRVTGRTVPDIDIKVEIVQPEIPRND